MNNCSLFEAYSKPLLLISAAILLVSVFPLPYGYYLFLRIVVTITSVMVIYIFHKDKNKRAVIGLALIAIIFNPIIPIHLEKAVWLPIDVLTAAYFYYLSRLLGEKYDK